LKTRTEKIQQYKKGNVFHADYIHTDYFEYWLNNFTKDGRTLNVCCGFSEVGDVRLDISQESSRTEFGDLFDLSRFQDQEFDYVYCDPLYKFYTTGSNRMRWQFELFRLAKKALITKRPKVNINMPSARHHYVILEDSRPSLSLVRVDWRY
jgi:hypothetical protein